MYVSRIEKKAKSHKFQNRINTWEKGENLPTFGRKIKRRQKKKQQKQRTKFFKGLKINQKLQIRAGREK